MQCLACCNIQKSGLPICWYILDIICLNKVCCLDCLDTKSEKVEMLPNHQMRGWLLIFEVVTYINIWAATCDFQQCGILTSVDSDEPVQPPFKLRNSKCCSISSLTVVECSADWQRLWSGWSEPLLIVHTPLLEISGRGSITFALEYLSYQPSPHALV